MQCKYGLNTAEDAKTCLINDAREKSRNVVTHEDAEYKLISNDVTRAKTRVKVCCCLILKMEE
jgi:hypothetical protein